MEWKYGSTKKFKLGVITLEHVPWIYLRRHGDLVDAKLVHSVPSPRFCQKHRILYFKSLLPKNNGTYHKMPTKKSQLE